jgi:transaldolase
MKRLIKAKLLVDTGDPNEAQAINELLRKNSYEELDGATTNPSYFAMNPAVKKKIASGEKYAEEDLLAAYQLTVQELEKIIPGGDISVEVFADKNTSAGAMVKQAEIMSQWIPTARIKLPIIAEGLKAAEQLKDRVRLNMTLCFSQQQAAAVYEATLGAKEPVYISPFIGRFEDRGQNGAELVGNIVKMMEDTDGHVKVLAASFRTLENIYEIIRVGTDVVTINKERFELWAQNGFEVPGKEFVYEFKGQSIPYEQVEMGKEWQDYNIQHELTEAGLQKFVEDWNALLEK